MARLQLYSRANCCLCDDMQAQLVAAGVVLEDIEILDVDQRPEWRALYGARVPVLLANDVEIASGRLTFETLAETTALLSA